MEIRTCPLDPDLTVAEIDPGTEQAWHFLPFEDRRGDLFPIDDRYVLALGWIGSRSSSVAIFDCVERRRTNIETNDRLVLGPSHRDPSWCYAPAHGSIFVPEAERSYDGKFPNPYRYLRQLAVDGSVNRRIPIAPSFHAINAVARDDGRIVCLGFDGAAVLDPAIGEAEVTAAQLRTSRDDEPLQGRLRWFSPDGRWALRPHAAPIVAPGTSPKGVRSLLARILSGQGEHPPEDERHPDLLGDGAERFGLGLDLFRLDPIGFERLLVVRYKEGEPFWQLHDVRCDDDCRGFTVSWVQGVRRVRVDQPVWARGLELTVKDLGQRHVTLNGAVSPIVEIPGEPEARELPSAAAIEAVKAEVRERSSHRVDCAGWTGGDVAASLREMRRMIEKRGLGQLVFGGRLQFRFRIDGRSIGEKKFFETASRMPPEEAEAILPELRLLMKSYGIAARKFQTTGFWPIASGPSEQSPGAMSEAAPTLATLDDTGFDALRDWVATVDQEHDYFAAAKVFPAMAKRTAFATVEAVRFGLWFFLQQWQTVKYEKSWFGLFKAAPEVTAPAQFAAAVLEEARDVNSFSDSTSLESGLARVQEMLGRTFWDRAVSAELDRMLAAIAEDATD